MSLTTSCTYKVHVAFINKQTLTLERVKHYRVEDGFIEIRGADDALYTVPMHSIAYASRTPESKLP
jgi:hypothetical protein